MAGAATAEQQDYTIGRGGIRLPVVDDRYKYVFHVGTFIDDLRTLNGVAWEEEGFGKKFELVLPPSSEEPLVLIRGHEESAPDDIWRHSKKDDSYVRSKSAKREVLSAPDQLGSFTLFTAFHLENGWRNLSTVSSQIAFSQGSFFDRGAEPDEEFCESHSELSLRWGQLKNLFIKEKVQTALQATVELLTD